MGNISTQQSRRAALTDLSIWVRRGRVEAGIHYKAIAGRPLHQNCVDALLMVFSLFDFEEKEWLPFMRVCRGARLPREKQTLQELADLGLVEVRHERKANVHRLVRISAKGYEIIDKYCDAAEGAWSSNPSAENLRRYSTRASA